MDFSEFVRAGVADWNAGDKESFLTRYDESSRFSGPGGSSLSGSAGAALFWDVWHTAFPDGELDPFNTFTDGRQGCVEGVFTGTHLGDFPTADGRVLAATGNRVRVSYAERWVVSGGTVASIRLYFDQLELLTQLGAVPEGALEAPR